MTGNASNVARTINLKKSLKNKISMLRTDAPNTLLMLISLPRILIIKLNNPISPIQETKMDKAVNTLKILANRLSDLYCSLK